MNGKLVLLVVLPLAACSKCDSSWGHTLVHIEAVTLHVPHTTATVHDTCQGEPSQMFLWQHSDAFSSVCGRGDLIHTLVPVPETTI